MVSELDEMPKSFREINSEILTNLDIVAEYRALGVLFSGTPKPRASGFVPCHAFGREDNHPSAWINIQTGYYGDSGSATNSGAYTLSLWDFAASHGGFATWQDARKAYAEKAGVAIGSDSAGRTERWRDRLEFIDWAQPGNDVLVNLWCRKHKKGVTLESLKAAGARLAYYPCYRDKKTGEQKRLKGHVQVIALPAYGDCLLASDPTAWVIWELTGAMLEVPQPKSADKSAAKQYAKMLSIGDTRNAMMGLAGLVALSDEDRRAKIEIVWKSGGPSDMLAIDAVIRAAGLQDTHVVVTNASGEMGDVSFAQSRLFAGLKTLIVGDADKAGVLGATKWAEMLSRAGVDVEIIDLPYTIRPKHGYDARDFLNGGSELLSHETSQHAE